MPPRRLALQDGRLSGCHHHVRRVLPEVIPEHWSNKGRKEGKKRLTEVMTLQVERKKKKKEKHILLNCWNPRNLELGVLAYSNIYESR